MGKKMGSLTEDQWVKMLNMPDYSTLTPQERISAVKDQHDSKPGSVLSSLGKSTYNITEKALAPIINMVLKSGSFLSKLFNGKKKADWSKVGSLLSRGGK